MGIMRSAAAALAGIATVTTSAAAHPGHGLEAGVGHELSHVASVLIAGIVVFVVAAGPGFIASRRH